MSTQKPYRRLTTSIQDPTVAKRRLVLAPMDKPEDSVYALFNPEELRMSLQINEGKLTPVGWSHPVKLYGSTGDWQFDIKLHFSMFRIWHRGYEFISIHDAMGWFSQLGYGWKVGQSPSPLIVIWPGTLTMAVTVTAIEQGVTRWDEDLMIRLGEVVLKVGEIRQKFKHRDSAAEGHLSSDEDHSASGPGSGFRPGMTGSPMNLFVSKDAGRKG